MPVSLSVTPTHTHLTDSLHTTCVLSSYRCAQEETKKRRREPADDGGVSEKAMRWVSHISLFRIVRNHRDSFALRVCCLATAF